MKKILAYEAAALALVVCVLSFSGRNTALLSPAEKSSLRDAVGEADFSSAGKNIDDMARQAREQAKKGGLPASITQQAVPMLKCSAHVASLETAGKADDMTFSIFKKEKSHYAKIAHRVDGRSWIDYEVVTYSNSPIRAGLTPKTDPDTELNDAERIILHAMVVGNNAEFKRKFSVNFDLAKVRSAQVYRVGEATKFGSASVVVAKDERDAVLGTFLGGFVVAMCK